MNLINREGWLSCRVVRPIHPCCLAAKATTENREDAQDAGGAERRGRRSPEKSFAVAGAVILLSQQRRTTRYGREGGGDTRRQQHKQDRAYPVHPVRSSCRSFGSSRSSSCRCHSERAALGGRNPANRVHVEPLTSAAIARSRLKPPSLAREALPACPSCSGS
jgi:hypothetical protein